MHVQLQLPSYLLRTMRKMWKTMFNSLCSSGPPANWVFSLVAQTRNSVQNQTTQQMFQIIFAVLLSNERFSSAWDSARCPEVYVMIHVFMVAKPCEYAIISTALKTQEGLLRSVRFFVLAGPLYLARLSTRVGFFWSGPLHGVSVKLSENPNRKMKWERPLYFKL